MEEESLKLRELYLYLKDQALDDDIIKYITTSFKKMIYHYSEYTSFDPWILDKEELIQKYIDNIKSASKLNFVRDINENNDFVRRIIPLNKAQISIGYNKDFSGRYSVVTDSPKYYCPLIGITNRKTKEINMLFDEFAKSQYSFLLAALPHELMHVTQAGFDLPWYVINRFYFTKCLTEGNAIRESRYASNKISAFYKIPFRYNEEQKSYETCPDNNYNIYKYIYSKFEILLGNDFMNKWARAKNDFTYLAQARKLIDSKYGKGIFEKIYEAIQIILFNTSGLLINDLKEIINELIIKALVYEDIDLSNKRPLTIEEIFRDRNSTSYIHEMIIRQNPQNFKIINSANIRACQEVIDNPNSLTIAIVKLESLIIKCLLKDLNDNSKTEYKKCDYYISNLGVESFKCGAMSEIKDEFIRLRVRTFLKLEGDSSSEEYDNEIKCLSKKEHR